MSTTKISSPEELKSNLQNLTSIEIATLINDADKAIPLAVEHELPSISLAIEEAAKRFVEGGRLIYIGAGTSGRLGALDAIELTPTYGIPPERAFGILAGGNKAMYTAVEGAEDSIEMGITDLKDCNISEKDVLIGIAASGNTPYTLSAINYGNEVGALTISITCNPTGKMNQAAQIKIAPLVGPEIIDGSTRMKAGTAQKMVLNALSTGIMIKSGYVYQKYMIYVQATNQKLRQRAVNIVTNITKADTDIVEKLLIENNYAVAEVIVMLAKTVSFNRAQQLLQQANGDLKKIL